MKDFKAHLDEQLSDDYYAVCLHPLDDIDVYMLEEWCYDNIGEKDVDWGHDYDEFYSPLSSGDIFWFATDTNRVLFRITHVLKA